MIPFLVYCAEQLRYEGSPPSASSRAGKPSARPALGLVEPCRKERLWLTFCAARRAFPGLPAVLQLVNRAGVTRFPNTGPSEQRSLGGAP